jgi:hypothetical protein
MVIADIIHGGSIVPGAAGDRMGAEGLRLVAGDNSYTNWIFSRIEGLSFSLLAF